ncbi:MAG: alpha/beta fold hydrolase [Candidatus Fimenecus sp.]
MAIRTGNAYFNSSTGVNKIHAMYWYDDEMTPIGIMQIAHGMCEHIGHYTEFAHFLAKNGFVVCGNDHLGHGKSVESSEDYGFIAEKDGDKRLVDDMHILTRIMKKKYPNLPYFLLGHSMGSFAVRVYAACFGDEIDGFVLIGTGELPEAIGILQAPINELVDKFGARSKVDFLMPILNKMSSAVAFDFKDEIGWITSDEKGREDYRSDELMGHPFKLGGYRDVVALFNKCSEKTWASKIRKDMPILILGGTEDVVGMKGKGVIAVQDNLESVGISPTVMLYKNARHDLLQEKDREKISNDILNWLRTIYLTKAEGNCQKKEQ